MPERLTDTQIAERLARLPHWRREGDTLRRTVKARDFPTAIAIVDDVATQAEKMNHHPDIDIRWRTLHFSLTTHSEGGITAFDADLARLIDDAVESHS